jgi:hypothetical protein
MQIISALAWPVVVLVAIGAALAIVRWLRSAIAQAVTERPVKLGVAVGKMRATAETRGRDKLAEYGKLIEEKPSEPKVSKRVDAELFVLRDEHGRERAKFGVTDTDATSLTLYDARGKERISIFVLADGSSTVALYDDKRVRTMLSRGETAGVDGLTILGPDHKNGIYLLVSAEGDPSFDIIDQRGLSILGV